MHPDVFRGRRQRVFDAMLARGGGVAIQPTAPEYPRNGDNDYPYRHDSRFYYLTGFAEPEALLVLIADARGGGRRVSILFCRDKDPEREIWDGVRCGPHAACESFGFDAAYSVTELDEHMPDLIADTPALFYGLDDQSGAALGGPSPLEARIQRWRNAVRAMARKGVRTPPATYDLHALIDPMRLIKDEHEIATMRSAARLSAAAHLRAMQKCRPGWREYQLEAELLHEFRRRGATSAYNAIVAAGANACILHHRAGAAVLQAGKLCLIDAGCELDSYASDVSRTFPVDGRFSAEQRAVYDIVLAAQSAALAQVRPGSVWSAPDDAAVRVLTQGLLDLGLLEGSVDGAIESGAYKQFYMHRTGHWLGMDVHDVGDYREPDSGEANSGEPNSGEFETDRASADAQTRTRDAQPNAVPAATAAPASRTRPWRKLAAGMVLTVEPGLYLRPAPNVPGRFENIGVRIEDDILVTSDGHEVLSADAPKAPADIEAAMHR